MQAIFGVMVLVGLCWVCSENSRRVRWKMILVGLALQFSLALLLVKVPFVNRSFMLLNRFVEMLESATAQGTMLVFGFLGGGALPFTETSPGAAYILAFRGLPIVLVVSALSSLFFYWRILPRVVKAMSYLLERTMRISGSVGVSAGANIFMGMIEAPLLIRPYLAHLTRSELFMIMTCGMSTIAGTVLVLYASILSAVIPGALGQILTASIISAPAALMYAHLLIPGEPGTMRQSVDIDSSGATSSMDAIVQGTMDGLKLLLNIVAMLVVLVALVALANQLVGLLPMVDGTQLSLQRIAGWCLAPLAWLIGIPWDQATLAGSLLGSKVFLNEFIAYLELAALPADALSANSRLILLYAMCGFANFGSLGIMIGGLGVMVPERRHEIVGLGLKSIVSGLLATCTTGAVIGLLHL